MLHDEHSWVDRVRQVVHHMARYKTLLKVDGETTRPHVEQEGENNRSGVGRVLLALLTSHEVGQVGGAEGRGELRVRGDDARAHTAGKLAELELPIMNTVCEGRLSSHGQWVHGLVLERVLDDLRSVL